MSINALKRYALVDISDIENQLVVKSEQNAAATTK
jgi:hypothetical protein